MNIKVGDLVECIDAGSNIFIKNGEIYRVSRVYSSSLRLEGLGNTEYYTSRFKLVEKWSDIKAGDKFTVEYTASDNTHQVPGCIRVEVVGGGSSFITTSNQSGFFRRELVSITSAPYEPKVGDRVTWDGCGAGPYEIVAIDNGMICLKGGTHSVSLFIRSLKSLASLRLA